MNENERSREAADRQRDPRHSIDPDALQDGLRRRLDSIVTSIESVAAEATTAIVLLGYIVVILPRIASFPYSDEWIFADVVVPGSTISLRWLFALHNDHRIPILKFVHAWILRADGGDFRALPLLNVGMLSLTSIAWVRIARMMRDGRGSIGDVAIPLLLVSGGFNALVWGFNFQFVSSIAFGSFAAFFVVGHLRGATRFGLELALASLLLCAWSGGNGLVSSVFFAGPVVCVAVLERATSTPAHNRARLALGIAWAATIVGLVATWRPSGATAQSGVGLEDVFATFVIEMSKSWMGVYASPDASSKRVLALAVVVSGALVAIGSMLRRFRAGDRSAFECSVLVVALAQSMAIIGVIAASRAVAQPWFDGLELHYGILTVLIPVASWTAISSLAPARVERAIGLVVAVGALVVFESNASWRIGALREGRREVASVRAAIVSREPAERVVDRHIRSLYYVDGPEVRLAVVEDLRSLRRARFWRPGRDDSEPRASH